MKVHVAFFSFGENMHSIWLVHLGFEQEQPKTLTVNSYDTACKITQDFLQECMARLDHEWENVAELTFDGLVDYCVSYGLATVKIEQSDVITMRN